MITAAMLIKNESWCLRATIPAALDWCDSLVVLDDGSTDGTLDIVQDYVSQYPQRVKLHRREKRGEFWDEMEARQELANCVFLEYPLTTVFGLVDADEMLPEPFRRTVAGYLSAMEKDQVLAPPALNPWNCLFKLRVDKCQWTMNYWTMAIKVGRVPVSWHVAADGYTHHRRVPENIGTTRVSGVDVGVIHLQFANYNRRLWKHAWYKMTELLRWGGKRNESCATNLNRKYGAAFDETGLRLVDTPASWFKEDELKNIDVDSPGWYKEECETLMGFYGRDRFTGLKLPEGL